MRRTNTAQGSGTQSARPRDGARTRFRVFFQTRDLGFTLIELLIVVAIISILSSISVPNFLEAQTRAKVARVKADSRTLATGAEVYSLDNDKYPIRRDQWDVPNFDPDKRLLAPPFIEKIIDPDKPTAAVGMHVITTPIKYLSCIPTDPFNIPARDVARMYPDKPYSDALDYWDPVQADALVNDVKSKEIPGWRRQPGIAGGYVIVSPGPDMHMGFVGNAFASGGDLASNPGKYPSETVVTINSYISVYDPSNGTLSTGNIYRLQTDASQRMLTGR